MGLLGRPRLEYGEGEFRYARREQEIAHSWTQASPRMSGRRIKCTVRSILSHPHVFAQCNR